MGKRKIRHAASGGAVARDRAEDKGGRAELPGFRSDQRHRGKDRCGDRGKVRHRHAGHTGKASGTASGGPGDYGKQAGGYPDFFCGEPDAARHHDTSCAL